MTGHILSQHLAWCIACQMFLLSLSYKILLVMSAGVGVCEGALYLVPTKFNLQPSHLACRCAPCPWRCCFAWEWRPLSSGPSCRLRCWACGTYEKSLASILSQSPRCSVSLPPPCCLLSKTYSRFPWKMFSALILISCVTFNKSLASLGLSSLL